MLFLRRSRRLPQASLERLWTARRAGDPAAYLELAARAKDRYPTDPEALIEWAQALSQNQRFKKAGDAAAEAAGLTADGAILVLAAWTLVGAKRYDQAGAAVARVLAADPTDPVVKNEALYLRGATYDALGEPDLAEQFLRGAVAGDDQLPHYIVDLARLLVRQDRRSEASELVAPARAIADAAARHEALSDLADLGLLS